MHLDDVIADQDNGDDRELRACSTRGALSCTEWLEGDRMLTLIFGTITRPPNDNPATLYHSIVEG